MRFFVALLAIAMIYLGATGKYRDVYTVLTGKTLAPIASPFAGPGAGGGGGGGGSSGFG